MVEGGDIFMLASKALSQISKIFNDSVFPPKCFVCNSFFHVKSHPCFNEPGSYKSGKCFKDKTDLSYFKILMSPILCRHCLTGLLPVESPLCLTCGIMFQSRTGEDHICGECIKSPKKFRKARAAGIYNQAIMALIHCFKYKGKLQLARPLGTLLFIDFIRNWDISSIDIIMPVPLHFKRFRARGFNQAFLLIKNWFSLADKLKIQLSEIRIRKDVLLRNRYTLPQTGLGRKERMTNIKNAFSLDNQAAIRKKRILLVDDVYTTGVTANECAKVLLRGGARHVDVLTLARTM